MSRSMMTEDWRPLPKTLEKLRERFPRYDLEYYIEECRDHWLGNGRLMKSWDATFRNWVRRADKFGNPKLLRSEVPRHNVTPIGGERQQETMSREEAMEKFNGS